jgi:hypothetical protein
MKIDCISFNRLRLVGGLRQPNKGDTIVAFVWDLDEDETNRGYQEANEDHRGANKGNKRWR